MGNTNWVLRAGELHICFAALHALGKYIEGSGLDTLAIETGIYSPATLRQIFAGKSFKRGVQYHLMNALACYCLKYEQLLGDKPPAILVEQSQKLQNFLHHRQAECADVFNEICSFHVRKLDQELKSNSQGELEVFLTNYLQQVECLLHLIRACRQGDWAISGIFGRTDQVFFCT